MSESHFTEDEEREALRSQPTLGMHGIVRDPIVDLNGRPVYCRDECICSHCAKIIALLHETEGRARGLKDLVTTLRSAVFLMFALGLIVAALAYRVGRWP